MIKVVYPNCAGLDVHKKFVTVCRLTVDKQGQVQKELREYSTMTADLQALADWLAEGGVTHVAMESTGVYWQPINNILSSVKDRLAALPAAEQPALPRQPLPVPA